MINDYQSKEFTMTIRAEVVQASNGTPENSPEIMEFIQENPEE